MDGKGATSAMQIRHRNAFKTPNPSKPLAKAVTVSAAGPFKARKLDTPLQPSTRSAQNSTVGKNDRMREGEEAHPLALAFKEKSEEYRRHLYSNAVARIDKDLDTLLNKLYESNLQVDSSEPVDEDSQTSPLKLTLPAKYQRIVQKLCHPLGSYRYTIKRMTSSGEIERNQTSLFDRFQAFEAHIQAETEQIAGLQQQWEGVVAEIFQLGVTCLGGADIAALLSTVNVDLNAPSSVSKAESTLFVPEHGTSEVKSKGKRKRVSFVRPDMMALFPDFLFHAPGMQKPVPATPDLPPEEVQKLKDEVFVLGRQHSAGLRQLEDEHKAWWERKQNQLAHTFLQD